MPAFYWDLRRPLERYCEIFGPISQFTLLEFALQFA